MREGGAKVSRSGRNLSHGPTHLPKMAPAAKPIQRQLYWKSPFSGHRFRQSSPECGGAQGSRGARHFGRLLLQEEFPLSRDTRRPRRRRGSEAPPLPAQASQAFDAPWACRRNPATSPGADNGDCISLRRTSFSNSCPAWQEEAVGPPESAAAVTARLRASASPWT